LVVALLAAGLTACAGSAPAANTPVTRASTPHPAPSSASSAGVPAGTTLRPSGSVRVDQPGQVLDGLDVRGSITVAAPDVVIKRSLFTGDGNEYFAITTIGVGSVTIEDVTIRGNYLSAGIASHNWRAERVDIYGMTHDGVKLGNNVSLSHSWIHDFRPELGAHSDGLQSDHLWGNMMINQNTIDVGTTDEATSAIILSSSPDPIALVPGPVLIEGNTLGGGANTFYHNADYRDVRVIDNVFLRDYRYQPIYPGPAPKVFERNHFPDGQPVVWRADG
jgi:hypothetical protein